MVVNITLFKQLWNSKRVLSENNLHCYRSNAAVLKVQKQIQIQTGSCNMTLAIAKANLAANAN